MFGAENLMRNVLICTEAKTIERNIPFQITRSNIMGQSHQFCTMHKIRGVF
jgi:hypothetical protein